MRRTLVVSLLTIAALATALRAEDDAAAGSFLLAPRIAPDFAERPAPRTRTWPTRTERICTLIADAAETHGLPEDFFARLIWKESRFDAQAVSPAGAQGIAQFMPATAALRGLADPFDMVQAIPASAALLADLRMRFGNLGLAAAAYNSGADRVARWLVRGGRLPWETEDYVLSITARPAAWFREAGREITPRPLDPETDFATACAALPVLATRAFAGTGRPWGVQVAAGISAGAAQRAGARALRRYGAILGEQEVTVVRLRRNGGRPRYSARIGVESRADARQLCRQLRTAGAPCIVRRN
ncbi:MAG: lytic transglycosylase domain-containing protein [Pseudomonadota bacterium]